MKFRLLMLQLLAEQKLWGNKKEYTKEVTKCPRPPCNPVWESLNRERRRRRRRRKVSGKKGGTCMLAHMIYCPINAFKSHLAAKFTIYYTYGWIYLVIGQKPSLYLSLSFLFNHPVDSVGQGICNGGRLELFACHFWSQGLALWWIKT